MLIALSVDRFPVHSQVRGSVDPMLWLMALALQQHYLETLAYMVPGVLSVSKLLLYVGKTIESENGLYMSALKTGSCHIPR